MSISAVLALLILAAPEAAPSPLERFFIGTTEGSGKVDMLGLKNHTMKDRSVGRMDTGGALILDQIVEEQGKPSRRRTWRLVRSGGDRITGTISDVRGEVAGELTRSTLHLRYRMKDGPSVEQWITLDPGGRTAVNRMTFRRFGLKVATVESQIRKVD